jgi:hypothetical protein
MFRRIRGRGDFLAVIPTVIPKICHLCKIDGCRCWSFGMLFLRETENRFKMYLIRATADGSFLKLDHPTIPCSTAFIHKIQLQAETRTGAPLGSILTPRKPSMFVFPEIRTRSRLHS